MKGISVSAAVVAVLLLVLEVTNALPASVRGCLKSLTRQICWDKLMDYE